MEQIEEKRRINADREHASGHFIATKNFITVVGIIVSDYFHLPANSLHPNNKFHFFIFFFYYYHVDFFSSTCHSSHPLQFNFDCLNEASG